MKKLLATLALLLPALVFGQVSGPYVYSNGGGSAGPTAVPVATATPLAFSTPGRIAVHSTPGANFQPYAGFTPGTANSFVTGLDGSGAPTLATPVPQPTFAYVAPTPQTFPTPAPTASLPLSSTNGGTGTNTSSTTGYPVVTGGAYTFPTAIPQAGVQNLPSDLANLAANNGGGSTGQVGNAVTSTCQPANTTGLTWQIPACTFTINGVSYTSTAGPVTLAAADATNPRIDALIFDTAIGGYASKITGTAAVNPSEPSLDPATQVFITNITVAANATAPTGLSNEIAYQENTEWTCTAGTGWNCADTSNPRTGTKAIKATAVTAGNYTKLVRSTAFNPNGHQQENFWINPSSWPSGRSLAVTLHDANGAQIGKSITIQNGSFGFSRTTTGVWQLIAIPVSLFSIPPSPPTGAIIKELHLNPVGTGGTFTFLVDDVVFQTSTNAAVFPNPQYDARYLPPGSTYAVLEKGSDGLLAASNFSANAANMYASNARFASSSGPLQLGIPSGSTPTISSEANATSNGSSTPSVIIPTGTLPGDLLLLLGSRDNNGGAPTTPTGWSVVGSVDGSNNARYIYVYYRIATGTEVDFTISTAGAANWITKTYRIANFDSSATPAFASVVGTSTTPDPPSLSPSWGSANTLWFAAAGISPNSGIFTGFPSGYSNTFQALNSNGISFGVASRSATTATENPGAFASDIAQYVAVTIGIKPAGSGSTQAGATIDTNGTFSTVAGANNLSLVPKASGTPVALVASGTDTNIDVNVVTKGSGVAKVNGTPIPMTAGLSGSLTAPKIPVASGAATVADSSFSASGAVITAANAGYGSSSGAVQLRIPSGTSPTIADYAYQTTSSATPTIPMPATFNPNDMLLWCMTGADSGNAITGGTTGWTLVISNGGSGRMFCYYKIADGSETPLSVSVNNNTLFQAITWRITNFDLTTAPAVAGTNAASGSPDSPSLSPAWGSAATMWMSIADSQDNCTGYPASYTDNQFHQHYGNYSLCASTRVATTATENPGAYTTINTAWNAVTIGIKPAGSGSTQVGMSVGTDGKIDQMATANGVRMTGAVAGSPVSYAARGIDTDIDSALIGKGAGGALIGSTGSTRIKKHLSAIATLDFANQVAAGCEELSVTVTGAAAGDTCELGVPNGSNTTNSSFTCRVSASDTAKVKHCAVVSGDPASGSFRVDVWQH